MKTTPPKHCLHCQSENVIEHVRARDNAPAGIKNMELSLDKNPDAMIFKDEAIAEAQAHVCGDCGYVMFFVSDYGIRTLSNAKKALAKKAADKNK